MTKNIQNKININKPTKIIGHNTIVPEMTKSISFEGHLKISGNIGRLSIVGIPHQKWVFLNFKVFSMHIFIHFFKWISKSEMLF